MRDCSDFVRDAILDPNVRPYSEKQFDSTLPRPKYLKNGGIFEKLITNKCKRITAEIKDTEKKTACVRSVKLPRHP